MSKKTGTQKEKNMKKSVDLNEFVEEIKDMLDDVVNPFTEVIEVKDEETTNKSEDLSDEDISKNYESDDEHVDKWNNFEKACWSGYKQVGMKNKGGKKVPNCVPINKATGLPEEPKTSWDGIFKPKTN